MAMFELVIDRFPNYVFKTITGHNKQNRTVIIYSCVCACINVVLCLITFNRENIFKIHLAVDQQQMWLN